MASGINEQATGKELPGNAPRLSVARRNGDFGVYAVDVILPGQCFLQVQGEYRDHPSRFSLQVGWRRHMHVDESLRLEELMDRFPWRFLNHSCDGNCMVRERSLVAVRLISPGEEVTFNYSATEYDMAYPFACRCGSSYCIGEVRGFKYLAAEERERLRPLLNVYLQSLLNRPQIPAEDPVA